MVVACSVADETSGPRGASNPNFHSSALRTCILASPKKRRQDSSHGGGLDVVRRLLRAADLKAARMKAVDRVKLVLVACGESHVGPAYRTRIRAKPHRVRLLSHGQSPSLPCASKQQPNIPVS